MPEAKSALLLGYTPESPKKPAIIKISCGIGDTDGFPAFDVESDAYASKDDPKWGFLITGGAEFHMPLTVFQVTPDGLADKGGFRLGDIILEINEEDATQLTLAQAHEKIDESKKKIHFLLKSAEDMEENLDFEPGEEKSIVMRVQKALPPPVASIEARLMEMQRKLSEIAEIPKILSSTLATVSQTFGQLMPRAGEEFEQQQEQYRKYSYDEDAIDYELSDDEEPLDEDQNDDDDDEEHDELVEQLRQKCAAKKSLTPESDYASEANYNDDEQENEADDSVGDEDVDDDNNAADYYDYEESYAKEPKAADNAVAVDDETDEEDFLNTTYTWNIRNVPKLQLNDDKNESVYKDDENDDKHHNVAFKDDVAVSDDNESDVNVDDYDDDDDDDLGKVKSVPNKTILSEMPFKQEQEEKHDKFKLDKMERSWPWADREKIIYKQSTCHLVPRKPLGLVEQRIQLLAKQRLFENLQQAEKPK